jgi:hypothetical protein
MVQFDGLVLGLGLGLAWFALVCHSLLKFGGARARASLPKFARAMANSSKL